MWITQHFVQNKREREREKKKKRKNVIIEICYLLWMY